MNDDKPNHPLEIRTAWPSTLVLYLAGHSSPDSTLDRSRRYRVLRNGTILAALAILPTCIRNAWALTVKMSNDTIAGLAYKDSRAVGVGVTGQIHGIGSRRKMAAQADNATADNPALRKRFPR
jgi:hypothetical protein